MKVAGDSKIYNPRNSIVVMCWLEICQQFYTTISLDQKFYTHNLHTCGLFSLTINQRKCINISNLVFFCVKISTVSEKRHTRCMWNYKIYRCILYSHTECDLFMKLLKFSQSDELQHKKGPNYWYWCISTGLLWMKIVQIYAFLMCKICPKIWCCKFFY